MARQFQSTSPSPFVLFQYDTLKICSLQLSHTHSATHLLLSHTHSATHYFLTRIMRITYYFLTRILRLYALPPFPNPDPKLPPLPLSYALNIQRTTSTTLLPQSVATVTTAPTSRCRIVTTPFLTGPLSLFLSLTHTLSHTHAHTLSLLSLSLSLYTHTHTHTYTHIHTHTHTHTHTPLTRRRHKPQLRHSREAQSADSLDTSQFHTYPLFSPPFLSILP